MEGFVSLSLLRGANHVEAWKIVTIDLHPTRANTGSGYIGAEAAFVEPPDAASAQRYFDSGEYFLNAGTFMKRDTLAISLGCAWSPAKGSPTPQSSRPMIAPSIGWW